MPTRRSFFENIALFSALAALTEEEGFSQPQDDKVSNFWDAYFDEASRDPNQVSRGSNDADLIDPNKRVQLIHATDSGLIFPEDIDDKLLPAESDVVVTVNPSHFRPAPDDHKAIARSRGAQIRLDCIQTRPIMNLIAPMAWSGLAAWSLDKQTYSTTSTIDPSTKKTTSHIKVNAGPAPPNLKDLDFRDPNDPSAPTHNQVILMGGSGRMAFNVRGVSSNDRLKAVLDKSVQYSSIIAPFFGFAPLAIPALRVFTTLLGAVFNHQSVIMNSMPIQVLATQDAKKNPHDSSSVKIVSGDFIAIPGSQASNLKGNMDQLRVVNGWLVHQDADKSVPVEQRAQDPRVPEVTYLSVSMTVQSLADAQTQKGKG